MVAHKIADAPSLLAVVVRRSTFFQEDLLIMLITLEVYIIPPDKVGVDPCFVVAALIGRTQAQGFIREWRKHHETEIPSAGRIQVVLGTHKRQPSYMELLLVFTKVWCREASARRPRQRLP